MMEKSKSSKFKHVPKRENGTAGTAAVKKRVSGSEPATALAVYAVLAVVMVVLSVFLCKIPVFAACLVMIIEALLAACMHKVPLWLHLIVMAAEVAVGIFCGKILFMILGALLYFAAVFTISYNARHL